MLNGIIREIKGNWWTVETDSDKGHLKTLWIGPPYHPPGGNIGDKVTLTYERASNGAFWFARLV